jgi:hypothetical protein
VKLRTLGSLSEFLDEELSWRKRELTTIKFLVGKSRKHERQTLLRSGACLVYAHWEGFIKQAAIAYLNYVSLHGFDYSEISSCMMAICLRSKFRSGEFQSRISEQASMIDFLLSDMKLKANIPWDNAIDTRSNLNSAQFKEIVATLGLDYSAYRTKELMIDGRLIRYRHAVAHGERQELDFQEYSDLHNETVALIDLFRNDIENAAVTGRFRRTGPTSA